MIDPGHALCAVVNCYAGIDSGIALISLRNTSLTVTSKISLSDLRQTYSTIPYCSLQNHIPFVTFLFIPNFIFDRSLRRGRVTTGLFILMIIPFVILTGILLASYMISIHSHLLQC
jgi:hypothetical protein